MRSLRRRGHWAGVGRRVAPFFLVSIFYLGFFWAFGMVGRSGIWDGVVGRDGLRKDMDDRIP